jgi:hypothetical protein
MASAHEEESKKQVEQRELHEKLKRRHHALIAHFHTLATAISGSVDA